MRSLVILKKRAVPRSFGFTTFERKSSRLEIATRSLWPRLARSLENLGYRVTRQSGSHIRLTSFEQGEHHVTIPDHDSLRVGTLSAVLSDVAAHLGLSKEDLIDRLFG